MAVPDVVNVDWTTDLVVILPILLLTSSRRRGISSMGRALLIRVRGSGQSDKVQSIHSQKIVLGLQLLLTLSRTCFE